MADIGYFPKNLRINLDKVDDFFFVTGRSDDIRVTAKTWRGRKKGDKELGEDDEGEEIKTKQNWDPSYS